MSVRGSKNLAERVRRTARHSTNTLTIAGPGKVHVPVNLNDQRTQSTCLFGSAPPCRIAPIRHPASIARSRCHHDCGAGAFELRQLAALCHLHLQRARAAANDRAIGIRAIERMQQPPAAGAAPAAGPNVAAGLARRRHAARLRKRVSGGDAGPLVEQQIERCARSRPIHARLHRRARCHPHGGNPAAAAAGRQSCHRAHQRLADRNRLGLRKEGPEAVPVFFIGEGENVGADRLIDIDAQRGLICFRYLGDLGQAIVVRSHHDGDERDRHAELAAACGLLVNEPPVSRAALLVLLRLGRIVERKFDILKSADFPIVQRRDRIAVRGDRQLDWLGAQIVDERLELGMQAILAGAEIYRAHWQAVHHCSDLFERHAVHPGWSAIAERAREIALVSEPETECKPPLRHALNRTLARFRSRNDHCHSILRARCSTSFRSFSFAKKSLAVELQPDQKPQRWDDHVAVYEEVFEPLSNAFASRALDQLDSGSDPCLLDIGAGAGGAALMAASRGGYVVAVDASSRLVARIVCRASNAGLAGSVHAYVMDGMALALPDASFDAAISVFGVILFSDADRGMREIVRVLKPGGRAAIVAWTEIERYELATRLMGAITAARGPQPPPTSLPAQLRFRDEAVLRRLLADAGLMVSAIVYVEQRWHLPSARWISDRIAFAPGMAAMVGALGSDRGRVLDEFVAALERDQGRGEVELSAVAHIGIAQKPSVPGHY